MFRYLNFILLFVASVLLNACSTTAVTTKTVSVPGQQSQTVRNVEKVTQRTLRTQEKLSLTRALCEFQSDNHNSQRLLSETPLLVIVDGKAVDSDQTIKHYRNDIAPFDMLGCLAEGKRWWAEKSVLGVLGWVNTAISKGAPAYFAYKAVDSITKNAGSKNTASDDAVINVGDDNKEDENNCELPSLCPGVSEYLNGECGLPIDPELAQCLTELLNGN